MKTDLETSAKLINEFLKYVGLATEENQGSTYFAQLPTYDRGCEFGVSYKVKDMIITNQPLLPKIRQIKESILASEFIQNEIKPLQDRIKELEAIVEDLRTYENYYNLEYTLRQGKTQIMNDGTREKIK